MNEFIRLERHETSLHREAKLKPFLIKLFTENNIKFIYRV